MHIASAFCSFEIGRIGRKGGNAQVRGYVCWCKYVGGRCASDANGRTCVGNGR